MPRSVQSTRVLRPRGSFRSVADKAKPRSRKKGISMSLSTDMDRLTAEIRQAAEFRKAAINDLRGAVKSTLAACATMRGEAARDFRAESQKYLAALAKDTAALAKEVSRQQRATATHMTRVASARRKAGRKMRSNLSREVGAIMKEAHALQAGAIDMVMSLGVASQKRAEQQRAVLGGARRKLRADNSRSVGGMRADRMKARAMWSKTRPAASHRRRGKATRRAEAKATGDAKAS